MINLNCFNCFKLLTVTINTTGARCQCKFPTIISLDPAKKFYYVFIPLKELNDKYYYFHNTGKRNLQLRSSTTHATILSINDIYIKDINVQILLDYYKTILLT